MTEEKPSEPLEFILLSFGLVVFSVFLGKIIIDSINIFIYFFAKASPQQMSNFISELITVSAGTPGNVKINFVKPEDNEYNIYFKDRMVFVEIYDYKKPVGISDEEFEKLVKKSHSSSAVSFEARNFHGFEVLIIEKEEKIKLNSIGGLNE